MASDRKGWFRPLPSVGVPLLRAERTERRKKTTALVIVFIVVPLLGFGAWRAKTAVGKWWQERHAASAKSASEKAAQQKDAQAHPSPGVPGKPGVEYSRIETKVGRAFSFYHALLDASLDENEALIVQNKFTGRVDFEHCLPDHRLVVVRDEGGNLLRFEYHKSAVNFVELTRDAQGAYVAREIKRAPVTHRLARSGVIQQSLEKSIIAAGLPPSLSSIFAEAFDGRIDFSRQARKGDVFRVVLNEELIDGVRYRTLEPDAFEYFGAQTGSVRAYRFSYSSRSALYYDSQGRAMQGGVWRTPLRYRYVSSRFNLKRMHPILHRVMPHLGVDYVAPRGTAVRAARDGIVVSAQRDDLSGNLVVLKHDSGFQSYYAHLQRIDPSVRRGRRVRQGQTIGFVGSTGRSTGPHLHFALKRWGGFTDPLATLSGPGPALEGAPLREFETRMVALNRELDAIPTPAAPPVQGSPAEPLPARPEEALD